MDGPHLPKGALPDNLDRLKVVDAESASFQSGEKRVEVEDFNEAERNLSQPEELGFFCCMLTSLFCSHLTTFNISFGFHNLVGMYFCIQGQLNLVKLMNLWGEKDSTRPPPSTHVSGTIF